MRFLILGLTILLISCATTMTNYYPQTIQSWKGATAQSLIKTWGRPDTLIKSPTGDLVLLYKTEGYQTTNAPASPAVGVSFGANGRPVITVTPYASASRGLALTCTTVFIADKNGVIVDVQAIGNGCYAGKELAHRKMNPSKPLI